MSISGLTLSDSEHLSTTRRAYTLSCWFTILHSYGPGILHFPFGTALHTVCLHWLTSFFDINDKPFPPVMSISGLTLSDSEHLDGDFEYFKGEAGKLHAGAILGHEFCAEVAEVGEGVEEWSVGNRVTLSGLRRGCGQCYFCQRRLYHLCLGVAGI